MKNKIEWIFFDIGFALLDETKAYEHRIKDTIQDSDVSYEEFYNSMIEFYRQNKKGDLEAAKKYNLKLSKWHSEDEILYPETREIIKKLHKKYKIGIIANQVLGRVFIL